MRPIAPLDAALAIASILPRGEGFSPDRAGAIALCVRDFTLASRYRDATIVLGSEPGAGFDALRYHATAPARWFERGSGAYARACARFLHEHRPRLVEIHNRPQLLRRLARAGAQRFALHLHNDPQTMDGARSVSERRELLALCDAIYCVSRYVQGRFAEGLGLDSLHKLHVVYNGLALPPSPPPKENLIVFAGRMTEEKGALMLAIALAETLPTRPGWRAALIGSRRHAPGGKPTPYERRVEAALQPLGDRAQLTGYRPHDDTMALFARAAIAVVPSLWQEPFGRTALEAMACGCALISSGLGGLREVTGDAALTLLAPTAAALSGALSLLTGDDAERRRLGARGRERAAAFAITERAQALDEVRAALLA